MKKITIGKSSRVVVLEELKIQMVCLKNKKLRKSIFF